jgi:DNA polymerase III sliding clamp (beta) subunit (PCNA family)
MPKTTTIQSETFCRAIEAVHRCASKDVERPHLNAILLEVNGQEVRAVTTNGHMVADYHEEQSSENKKAKYLFTLDGAVDAARAVKKFGKRWPHTPGGPEITLKGGKRQVVLSYQEETIIGIGTVDEDFPPIEKVIPKTGREPKFKDNILGLKASLIIRAMQCFTALGVRTDFLCWDFGEELDPVCVFKRYIDYSATLMVVLMPARVDAESGRAG